MVLSLLGCFCLSLINWLSSVDSSSLLSFSENRHFQNLQLRSAVSHLPQRCRRSRVATRAVRVEVSPGRGKIDNTSPMVTYDFFSVDFAAEKTLSSYQLHVCRSVKASDFWSATRFLTRIATTEMSWGGGIISEWIRIRAKFCLQTIPPWFLYVTFKKMKFWSFFVPASLILEHRVHTASSGHKINWGMNSGELSLIDRGNKLAF